MTDRYHSFAVVCIFFISFIFPPSIRAENAWRDSLVGKCFQSKDEYLTVEFGVDSKLDENIKIIDMGKFKSSKKGASGELSMIIDATPGVNVTRIFFVQESQTF